MTELYALKEYFYFPCKHYKTTKIRVQYKKYCIDKNCSDSDLILTQHMSNNRSLINEINFNLVIKSLLMHGKKQ